MGQSFLARRRYLSDSFFAVRAATRRARARESVGWPRGGAESGELAGGVFVCVTPGDVEGGVDWVNTLCSDGVDAGSTATL